MRVRRPSPALIVASIALVFSITGAATAARSLIKGKEIARGTITGANLKNGTITKGKLAKSALPITGATGAAGPAGAQGPAGPGGPPGERGPSEAYVVTGPSPIGLVAGSSVTVAQLTVPPGAYTIMASGFIYPSGPPVGSSDQFICAVYDETSGAVGMPSQLTLSSSGDQYQLIGATNVASGKLRLDCQQIAFGGADPGFTQLSGRIVATRVGSITRQP